ncbi:phosphate-starvation-inducible PsiE family protein [Tropicibacter sp. R16_0]|uniref:phosphate-starvation-inducible PsiE family protein n=1 Tax=Tropicibacter sp. R16_0 TaxID=2821102 RepID=UPI001ADA67EA|nr:phosphate-starvation-inducible PsiE family protein [Tropicibacter sp. R16_0]MBO9452990.1 phosphate-starvation-inducible PsiE family protein [Tropicibacter sp. R16_0]
MSNDGENTSAVHVELDPDHEDAVVRWCNRMIRHGVRVMSVLMLVIIALAIIDAGFTTFQKLVEPPVYILEVSDLLAVFSAVLVVLIAIEIYTNISLYLTADVIHIKLVVATALMAVARKVITLDDKTLEPEYFWDTPRLGCRLG